MTNGQFDDLVRDRIRCLAHPKPYDHHYRFLWDRETGYSHDMVCYGPFDCSSSVWIVPGTIEESEYDIDPEAGDPWVWEVTNKGTYKL